MQRSLLYSISHGSRGKFVYNKLIHFRLWEKLVEGERRGGGYSCTLDAVQHVRQLRMSTCFDGTVHTRRAQKLQILFLPGLHTMRNYNPGVLVVHHAASSFLF